MNHIWALSKMRMKLALRTPTFLFFSLTMPILFLIGAIIFFGRGNSTIVPYLLGAILSITVMGSFWGLSIQLVTFREQGILRRFRLAPIGPGAMLGSSIISNYFLVLPTVLLEFLISRYVFHMRTWGNLWQVFLLVSIGAATFASLGLIVASVTNDMQETTVINNIVWSAFLFISGATLPVPIMPGWVQKVTLFLPATYLTMGLEKAMGRSAGPREIVEDVVALVLGLAISFIVSQQLFRWEPEEKIRGKRKLWAAAALIPFLLLGAYEITHGKRLQEFQKEFQMMSQRIPNAPR
jgi:ABC-2 type transport system permease protein